MTTDHSRYAKLHDDCSSWAHGHSFTVTNDEESEKKSRRAAILTFFAMIVEIGGGIWFNSLAVQADGWHMATHAAALGIAVFAYRFARSHARDPNYSFGTGKVTALAGFGNASALLLVALLITGESIPRLLNPSQIHFNEALIVAALGLVINLVTAWLLRGDHGHSHSHAHGHSHDEDSTSAPDHTQDGHESHHAHDHNLRAAYMHVVSDLLVSVIAIIALMGGKYFGWVWLDPLTGIIASVVIARWAFGLMKECAAVLLDRSPLAMLERVRTALEIGADVRVVDLHLWSVAPKRYAAIISLVADAPEPPENYKTRLAALASLVHVTIEVHPEPAAA